VRNYGSEKEAQMRIYEASWDGTYEFRCEIDEDASKELASMISNPSVNCVVKKLNVFRCCVLIPICPNI